MNLSSKHGRHGKDFRESDRIMVPHKPKTLGLNSNEAAIRELYQQMIDGWNAGNGDAFAAPYTDDIDFIRFDGTYMKGLA
jgi:hypothetical protein